MKKRERRQKKVGENEVVHWPDKLHVWFSIFHNCSQWTTKVHNEPQCFTEAHCGPKKQCYFSLDHIKHIGQVLCDRSKEGFDTEESGGQVVVCLLMLACAWMCFFCASLVLCLCFGCAWLYLLRGRAVQGKQSSQLEQVLKTLQTRFCVLLALSRPQGWRCSPQTSLLLC